MHSIFFCISFRKTATPLSSLYFPLLLPVFSLFQSLLTSHSYRLTILSPSSFLPSPYFNPCSLLTPIASLYFLPPPSCLLLISIPPHFSLLSPHYTSSLLPPTFSLFQSLLTSHSYLLTILPLSSFLLSPYFNPSSLLTPISSLYFLPSHFHAIRLRYPQIQVSCIHLKNGELYAIIKKR